MKNICSNCIGEEYLSSYIRKNGILDDCSYCKKRRKFWNLEKSSI